MVVARRDGDWKGAPGARPFYRPQLGFAEGAGARGECDLYGVCLRTRGWHPRRWQVPMEKVREGERLCSIRVVKES